MTTKNENEKELIKHAAVKSIDGMIFLGKRHADCFHQAHNVGIKMSQKACDQGFFTNKGRYVDRIEAMIIAKAAGQLDELNNKGPLFSEMLWCETDGGMFDYDSIKGYW